MVTEQIIIEYIAQVEGLKAQLRTVQTELKGVQKSATDSAKAMTDSFKGAGDSIKGIATGIASSLAIAFSVQKVIQFAGESIKAFQESESVAKKLEFAITKIGKEGQIAFEKLNRQADIFAKKSIFDDESIRGAQTLLSQFGLQSDAIEKLIPQIIDLASATGQDLASATQLAISGINGQGRVLKPYGIILDDTGSKTENLRILTEGLTKFTGSAGEAFNTAAGQAKFYDNQINELQESIGEKLSPAFQAFNTSVLAGVNAQLDIFSSSIDGILLAVGTDNAKFGVLFDRFVKSSESAQTQITFDLAKKGSERTELEQRLFIEYRKILDARLNATSNEQTQEIGLTQKGVDAKLAAEKKGIEDALKAKEDSLKSYNDIIKLLEKWEFDSAVATTKKKKDELDKQIKDKEETQDIIDELLDEAEVARKKREDKERQDKEDITNAGVEFITTAVNGIYEYQNSLAEAQLQQDEVNAEKQKKLIEQQVASGVLTEQQGADAIASIDSGLEGKRKAAALEQAKRERQQALFNIAINTAVGVVKSLPNYVLAAIVAATGLVQAAIVAAKPLPVFAEGVIDLQGGVRGKDSIPALLMPGESVMTTAETERHGELLRSIRSKSLDEYLMDNYVNPKLSAILGNSTADNMAKSAKINGLNEYSLSRVMSRNKGVNVQNADYIAKAIAREMKRDTVKRTWSA